MSDRRKRHLIDHEDKDRRKRHLIDHEDKEFELRNRIKKLKKRIDHYKKDRSIYCGKFYFA